VVDGGEALHHVALAELVINRDHGGMAVQACAGRVGLLAFGERLVLKHVGVAAALAIVLGEGVAGPHGLEARIFFQLGTGDDRTRICIGGRARQGFAAAVLGANLVNGAEVEVVLHGEIFSPDCRVGHGVIEFDDAVKGVPRFLLALKDIDEQSRDREDRNCGEDNNCNEEAAGASACFSTVTHDCSGNLLAA
jgi:hypothetical protein